MDDVGIYAVEPANDPYFRYDYGVTNGGASAVGSPNYDALMDQVKQNNAWSAEQAQRQMDFQRQMWQMSADFEKNQAEINRRFQQQSADRAQAASSAEARANRDWQEYMSATAHQREMADLKAAGLNPILSANSGAGTGSGAQGNAYAASGAMAGSPGTYQGAKGNTDESGTSAIMSLMGKMMDNQIAREEMKNSAEVAEKTANMYTEATKYAAELAQIASFYSSESNYAASIYGSDTSYKASMNNLEHILGQAINQFMDSFNISGTSIAQGVKDTGTKMAGIWETLKGAWNTLSKAVSNGNGNSSVKTNTDAPRR